ncbi:protein MICRORCHIDIA 6 [Cocos nucifera]|uniref:Protein MICRORCHIDIA 6 n=1 Tax=Cocos nucifera TaxID=13894 RepID=A0A8K0I9M9_COCNU|nr:protein MICRORCHIDIA 6 [Cocos nucifera]
MEPGIGKALISHHPHILQNTLVGVSVACGAMQLLNIAVQGCIGLAFVVYTLVWGSTYCDMVAFSNFGCNMVVSLGQWTASGMSFADFVNLCSDEETEVKDVDPGIRSSSVQKKARPEITNNHPEIEEFATKQGFDLTSSNQVPNGCCRTNQGHLPTFCHLPEQPDSVPLCRQFWKAGDYVAGVTFEPISKCVRGRLRVHPKFLLSNATSHKWAFGAIAELLDNAVDELQNGATFVRVDKITNTRDGNHALLIQDDGGGMDPESLRRCMSFGFSDKQSESSIGQYGNGFKTSTMRLGADVIVFSRCMNRRMLTQSVGLLSYTFLRQTGCDDIVVPMVDYEFNPSTGVFQSLIRHSEKQFSSNLSTLLRWSPFATEVGLLKQFSDLGHHGTKIIVFNLWLNDHGDMELDFDSDAEAKVITTIGFLDGASYLNIHGFNIYHKNRLILPFWPVLSDRKGRGVAGVLEVNFLKPTHDKQDFEKSTLYYKLETRLKDMTLEYWDYHCHLVGYSSKKAPQPMVRTADPAYQIHHSGTCSEVGQPMVNGGVPVPFHLFPRTETLSGVPAVTLKPVSSKVDIPGSASVTKAQDPTGLPRKRRQESYITVTEALKRQAVSGGNTAGLKSNDKIQVQLVNGDKQRQVHEIITMMLENKKLRAQCTEFKMAQTLDLHKAQRLRDELQDVQQVYKILMAELREMDDGKVVNS